MVSMQSDFICQNWLSFNYIGKKKLNFYTGEIFILNDLNTCIWTSYIIYLRICFLIWYEPIDKQTFSFLCEHLTGHLVIFLTLQYHSMSLWFVGFKCKNLGYV